MVAMGGNLNVLGHVLIPKSTGILFPSNDGNLAVKELAWTPLRCVILELPSRWEMIAGWQ